MAPPRTVSSSRSFPVALEEAFDRTLAWPLPELFPARYLAIPPIVRVDQEGPWLHVGQARTIHTSDGGSMREQLVEVDPPRSFSYELTELTGPMKPLVSRVQGTWAFAPLGTGTRISWSWTIHPRSSLGAAALPVFGWMWRGYAARALDHLEDLLLTTPPPAED